MSEPAIEQPTPQDPNVGTGTTENAAPWSNYLTELPDSVRPLVEPIFKKWDGDVTQRFQTVHSEYEPLKPFQQVVQNGWDFADVQQALTVAQALNENPQAVYNALAEAYGYGAVTPEQGQSGEVAPDNSEEYVNPEIARYMEMTDAMAQLMTQQQQAAQAQQEDAQLNSTLESLKQKHGNFDEEYVMTKVYAGHTWDQAIEAYNNLVGNVAANRPAAPPVIMGSGGGLPSQVVNPAQMSSNDRKALVAQMIAQSHTQ